ncbi:tapasin-related protein-like [Mixophyes fleayi]|uniref:tapasin-related protein-like n=1 Tax=Mixophyes fleayi TaxID=3061075 RepID=UPI003F4D8234
MDEQGVKQGNASLSIHNVTISDQGTYKCLVIDSPDRQDKEIQLSILAAPKVKINKMVLRSDEENRIQCSITDFYPRNITVRWLRNGEILTGSVLDKFQMNADETYNANSSMTITPIQAKDNPKITCKVESESLQDSIQADFNVEYEGEESSHITSVVVAVFVTILITLCVIAAVLWFLIYKKKLTIKFNSVLDYGTCAIHSAPWSVVIILKGFQEPSGNLILEHL